MTSCVRYLATEQMDTGVESVELNDQPHGESDYDEDQLGEANKNEVEM